MRSTKTGLASGAAVALLCVSAAGVRAQEAEAEGQAPTRGLSSGVQLSLRLEPGLAVALTEPQSDMTEAGFSQTVKLFLGITPYLQVGPTAAFTTLPAGPAMADAGGAWSFGGGVRVMRPHDAAPGRHGLHAISPWVDADILYVRTGDLDRPGYTAAVGLAIPVDDSRKFWIGPFVRYFQIGQGERMGFDNRDAKVVTIGVSLEVGSGLARRHVHVDEPMPREEVATEPVAAVDEIEPEPRRSDRDLDGVFDDDDHCPDVVGQPETFGCPPYEKVLVQRDKLEVKEKIAFRWDSAELEDSSFAALDDVVRALQDNTAFRVEVGGHASSDGPADHNQRLSEDRAAAVRDYLISHGVAESRVVSKGFSSSEPLESNKTADGRETNRRVEFVIHFIILEDGSTP